LASAMIDLAYAALILTFFAASWGLVRLVERL
jgi:hypothetical protein